MKRFLKNSLLLPLMLLTAAACQIVEDIAPVQGEDFLHDDKFVILLAQPSKTANDGLSTIWVEGDKVNVFHAEAGSDAYVNDGAFEFSADDKFIGVLSESLDPGKSYDWYVSYPYDKGMQSPEEMRINIPSLQTQSEDGSMAHLCGSLCPLAGKTRSVSVGTSPSVLMDQLVTVMRIKVTNYSADPCMLETVSFCHHTSTGEQTILTGSYKVDFTGDAAAYTKDVITEPNLNISGWEENDMLTRSGNTGVRPAVQLETPKSLELNESATVYLACVPFVIPNATFLSIGMNSRADGVSVRICKEVDCKAGTINGVKQGSRLAPPFRSDVEFYYGQKNPDGTYRIVDDNWWRCDLPEGYDLNGEFDFKSLFTTLNTDASFTVIDASNQNPTVQDYFNDFKSCLSGSEWNGTGLNPDLNLTFSQTDKSGVFISVYAGYQVGQFNIFFRNPASESDGPVVDLESDMYDSYQGLVMAGYQGWHGTPSDGCAHNPAEGWPHYASVAMHPFIFEPGVLRNNIDFWPDVSEYPCTYSAPDGFKLPDGNTPRLYSSYDESTVDLHFRWMKDYGIDGVFMQRFVAQLTNPTALIHSDKVLQSAMTASNVHARAISIMYDMVGMDASTSADIILDDARGLIAKYNLMDRSMGQRYFLYHNGKPLVGLVSVGQSSAPYTIAQAQAIVDGLQELGFSIMLGVPAYWREPGKGDCVNDSKITDLVKDVDIIMPWFVGVYDYKGEVDAGGGKFSDYFQSRIEESAIGSWIIRDGDFSKAKEYKVEYCPLVFAGFSDRNIHPNNKVYKRYEGDFYWQQIYKYLNKGAKMLYVAMFDEIDEGTAIYKCLRQSEVPSNTYSSDYYVIYENGAYRRSSDPVTVSGSNWCKKASELGVTFNGIEDGLESDYYLWLTGEAGKMLRGETALTSTKPTR